MHYQHGQVDWQSHTRQPVDIPYMMTLTTVKTERIGPLMFSSELVYSLLISVAIIVSHKSIFTIPISRQLGQSSMRAMTFSNDTVTDLRTINNNMNTFIFQHCKS